MKNENDQLHVQIGRRLQAYRNRAGMTLRELADETGLSPSYLSKLESGKVGLSVANLDKIATGLGLGIDTLVGEDEEGGEFWVVRHDQRKRLVLSEGVVFEDLVPRIPEFGLSGSLVVCKAGDCSGMEMTTHKGDEFRHILQGVFDYWIGDEKFTLEPGDSISHSGELPHRWENTSSEDGIFLVVSTLPAY
jgi:transcriptional regulator with XRE-family HTH domain